MSQEIFKLQLQKVQLLNQHLPGYDLPKYVEILESFNWDVNICVRSCATLMKGQVQKQGNLMSNCVNLMVQDNRTPLVLDSRSSGLSGKTYSNQMDQQDIQAQREYKKDQLMRKAQSERRDSREKKLERKNSDEKRIAAGPVRDETVSTRRDSGFNLGIYKKMFQKK